MQVEGRAFTHKQWLLIVLLSTYSISLNTAGTLNFNVSHDADTIRGRGQNKGGFN